MPNEPSFPPPYPYPPEPPPSQEPHINPTRELHSPSAFPPPPPPSSFPPPSPGLLKQPWEISKPPMPPTEVETQIPEIDFGEERRHPHSGLAIFAAVIIFFLVVVLPTWYFLRSKPAPKEDVEVATEPPPPPPPLAESTYVVAPPLVYKITGSIPAKTGGKIVSGGSQSRVAEIEIPAEALRKDTTISLEYVGPADEKEDVTDLYILKPFGTVLLKPALIKIPYYEELLAKQGVTEDTIRLYVWTDEGNKRPIDFNIDRENKVLKTELVQF